MDDAPYDHQRAPERCKELGVRLSIDDFGTGYSSLAYLRRFPVDVLKIDRTFVDGLGKDLEDSAIVAAVVNLADTLGFATIAEGVETELQRDCLVGLGCSRAQGYLFAQPVTAAEAELALDRVGRRSSARPASPRIHDWRHAMTAPVARTDADDSVDANAVLAFLEQVKRGDFSARHAARLDRARRQGRRRAQRDRLRERDLLRASSHGSASSSASRASSSQRIERGGLARAMVGPDRVGQQPDRRPRTPDERDAARHRRGRRRRPQQEGLDRRPRRDARPRRARSTRWSISSRCTATANGSRACCRVSATSPRCRA